jgi:hypothetical protein
VADNSTYSIDLSKSWTNQTVTINPIDKGLMPVINKANLWRDINNNSFYSYNGDKTSIPFGAGLADPPPNQLWQFTPSGDSGTWTGPFTSNDLTLVRISNAAATTGNGIGYALGGYQNWKTSKTFDADRTAAYPNPYLISYDTSSQTWSNRSIVGLPGTGTTWNGELQFVPNFGTKGLLIALGGQTSAISSVVVGPTAISYASVSLYDPTQGEWHQQNTSGSIPEARANTCIVGVQGDSGTYEIFLYGGGGVSDAVYVLSLPSFKWQKTSYPTSLARYAHTCHVVGNRQMLVVGGVVNQATPQKPDTWTHGLGVFDMSAFAWKDSYDASAAPYVTPKIVKDDYMSAGMFPPQWNDATVQSWFVKNSELDTHNLMRTALIH